MEPKEDAATWRQREFPRVERFILHIAARLAPSAPDSHRSILPEGPVTDPPAKTVAAPIPDHSAA